MRDMLHMLMVAFVKAIPQLEEIYPGSLFTSDFLFCFEIPRIDRQHYVTYKKLATGF